MGFGTIDNALFSSPLLGSNVLNMRLLCFDQGFWVEGKGLIEGFELNKNKNFASSIEPLGVYELRVQYLGKASNQTETVHNFALEQLEDIFLRACR